ncbi:MAG: HlyD family efflux transporter periplasmic adaptor subunit [Planctomycetota bacterium]
MKRCSRVHRIFVIAAASIGTGVAAHAQRAVDPQTSRSVTISSVARASVDLELAFTVPGRLVDVLVDEGHVVEPGTALARLDDRQTRARLALFQARAESTARVDAARAALDLAKSEERRVRAAFENAGVNAFEVERAEIETAQAQHALALAEEQRAEATLEAELVRTQLADLTLVFAGTGVVERVFARPGEVVDAREPVLRIVSTDPLVADVFVPIDDAAGIEPGDLCIARGGGETLRGSVAYLAPIADSASATRRVRVRIENSAAVAGGTPVQVTITPE